MQKIDKHSIMMQVRQKHKIGGYYVISKNNTII